MQLTKREIDLQPEKPSNPWQVVEGYGQTWVILRSKLKVGSRDIAELGSLVLNSSSYELAASAKDRFLYRGKLMLQAFYSCSSESGLKDSDPKVVDDEHEAKELLTKLGDYPLGQRLIDGGSGSVFLSRLYEELPTVDAADSEKGREVWRLELPWQAWLEGGELEAEPEIVIAHLGQVGMETLLCEVLIGLTAKKAPQVQRGKASENYYLAGEESLLSLGGLKAAKVIGTAVKRAFFRLSPGKSALQLEFLTKIELLFISGDEGSERLLTAGAVFPETLRLPYEGVPVQPLYAASVTSEKIRLANAGEQKAIMKEHFIVTLAEDSMLMAEGEVAATTELELRPARTEAKEAAAGKPLPIRPRPGERWLKKPGEQRKFGFEQKKMLAIKLVH